MTRTSRNRRRGSSLVTALTLGVIASGLCAAMMTTVTSRAALARSSRAGMGSLDLANSGLAVARAELLTNRDLDGGGIGNAAGTIDDASYIVTSTKLDATHYRLESSARRDGALRSIESIVEVSTIAGSAFGYALFGNNWVTISGGSTVDAYDSKLGTYASQAVNSGSGGAYALGGADVASNGAITIGGTGTYVYGDATPGPVSSTTINGGGGAEGSTAPAEDPVDLPAIDPAPYSNPDGTVKASVKDLSKMTKTGKVTIGAGGDLDVGNGGVLTIPDGIYYVNSIRVANGGTVKVTGAVTIYLKSQLDMSGGSLLNASMVPGNLKIFGIGDESKDPKANITLSPKDGIFAAVYAPKMSMTLKGNGSFYGACVGSTIKDTGGAKFHYDEALKDVVGGVLGKPLLKQISWRRIATPDAVVKML